MAEPTLWNAFKQWLRFAVVALAIGLIVTQALKWFGITPPI